jgi:hypothetical protein
MKLAQKLLTVLGGGAAAPAISVSPTSWDFGSSPLGTTVVKQFTLTFTGTVTAISLPSGFSHDAVLPWVISGTGNFNITATAAYIGAFSGNVSITSNGSPNPLSIPIEVDITMIADAIQWLDADDNATVWQDSARTTPATANGDVIGALDDKSANAYHELQTTATNKPLGILNAYKGRRTIRFDGADNYLTKDFGASYAQPNMFFIVCNFIGASGEFVFDTPAGTNRNVLSDSGGVSMGFNAGIGRTWAHTLPTGLQLIRILANGASGSVFVNGVSKTTGDMGANPLTGMIFGARFTIASFGQVDLCESIIIDRNPSAGEIAAIEAYLTEKWLGP